MHRRVIANWKMNLSLQEATAFCEKLVGHKNLIIAAPAIYLSHLSEKFPQISFAAQDLSSHEDYGPYTGEISAKQLTSCGVKYAILGHLERRKNFGETDDLVKLKIHACISAGITPIVCLDSDTSLAHEVEGAYIAYEPKGSIGTGVIPSKESLDRVFEDLKRVVDKSTHLVYGGSVNYGNLALIKSVSAIDSILLGGAALKVDELLKILRDW